MSWLSNAVVTNQRFHIDLGSAKTVTRVYYENAHELGTTTNRGAKNFTMWGSNTASDFADLVYVNDGTWVSLTTDISQLLQHTASDVVDPKAIVVTNSTAYRYYAFKFADNWGNASYMGIRRIQLITGTDTRKELTLNDIALTSGRVPFATTNGRLTDDADFTFATDTLTATKIVGTTSVKVGTAAGFISSDGSTGATGTFLSANTPAKTITVKDGIITSIV